MTPIFKEIDLSKTTKKGGAGLEVGPTYLVLYCGQFHTGTFSMMWYGLNFNGVYGSGLQYDPPTENYSGWQKVWQIINASEIANAEEPAFMKRRRDYAISHKLESNGQPIDDSAPYGAFGYHPKVSAMPNQDDEL